jgi:hypothetical protein
MGDLSELLDGLGGKPWVRAIGAELEARATADVVRLVLPAGRSRCGANRAVVHRRREADGGGYAVEWWQVAAGEAEVVAELEGDKLANMAAAIATDVAEAA